MNELYEKALDRVITLCDENEDLDYGSAFKQAASDCGIPYGPEMKKFVNWAWSIVDGDMH
jgi:hypothetical protein